MTPEPRFAGKNKAFWAHVRTISQELGYTTRGHADSPSQVRVPTLKEISLKFKELNLRTDHLVDGAGKETDFALDLFDYFEYRANVLNNFVQKALMTAEEAGALYEKLTTRFDTDRAAPMNKQKGDKKQIAYLTAMVNLLIEKHCANFGCDFDPRGLTTLTENGYPLRTLARRVDGAFPSVIDPIAIWEIKEYYYTTTFGSRVADGVYETLLDGMELEEVAISEKRHIQHLLMIDAHFTWWKMGRSYLCRIIDMLHMGYVDEVLFGREIETRLPDVVSEWVAIAKERGIVPTGTPQPDLFPKEALDSSGPD